MNIFKLHVPYFYIGERELLATFFIVSGWMYRYLDLKIEENGKIIPLMLLVVITGSILWPCSMITLESWKVLPYIFSALAGIFIVFSLCKMLTREEGLVSKWLIYVGNNTLTILIWHFSVFKMVSAIIIGIYELPVQSISEFPVMKVYSQQGWWILYLVLGVVGPTLMSKVKFLKK